MVSWWHFKITFLASLVCTLTILLWYLQNWDLSILFICDKIWNQLPINKLLDCRLLFDGLLIHSRVTLCYIRLICTFYYQGLTSNCRDCFETKIHNSHSRCPVGCGFAILVGYNLVILFSHCNVTFAGSYMKFLYFDRNLNFLFPNIN